jgi:hemerythrin-like metal-binding protein
MTDLISWAPRMSVGVAILDEDHKRIMTMINKLHDALAKGEGKKILGDIFHGLMVYISIHFECEEAMFAQTGYQGAAEQKKQHDEMTAKTLAIRQQFHDDPDSVKPMEVLYFLKDWWLDHIMNADKKYASFLNANGIK